MLLLRIKASDCHRDGEARPRLQAKYSVNALQQLRRCVFLIKAKHSDEEGVGVGVFIGPQLAVTVGSVLQDVPGSHQRLRYMQCCLKWTRL